MRKLTTVALAVAVVICAAKACHAAREGADGEGGIVKRPGVGRGEIAIVDAQSRARREWLKSSADYFEAVLGMNVRVAEGKFSLPSPGIVGDMTLYVVDDETLPMSLAAVEAGWGMVNVAALHSQKEDVFKARVRKELSRCFAILCGGYASSFNNPLMTGMRTAADIDLAPGFRLPADTLGGCAKCLKKFGFEQFESATYKEACEQGWAPAPTNDVQRAIWEKVKADKERGPTNPITIPPPRK